MAAFTRSVPCGACGIDTQKVSLATLCLTCGTWICGTCLGRGQYGPTHYKNDQTREDHRTGSHKRRDDAASPSEHEHTNHQRPDSQNTGNSTGSAQRKATPPQEPHNHTPQQGTSPHNTTPAPRSGHPNRRRWKAPEQLDWIGMSCGDTEGFHQKHSPGAHYRHHCLYTQRRQIRPPTSAIHDARPCKRGKHFHRIPAMRSTHTTHTSQ